MDDTFLKFSVERPKEGKPYLLDRSVGEGMHSAIGPWEEANLLYVEQSKLKDRLNDPLLSAPLVIYDVGLGIATNALASIELFNSIRSPIQNLRPLHIISFENNITGLHFALKNALDDFPFLLQNQEMLETLLKQSWYRGLSPAGCPFQWELRIGDFREQVNAADLPLPELVYYDFYSPKVLPDLWGRECFQRVIKAALPRSDQGLGTMILTYSSSTAVRAALLLAGFHVGYGISTGKKRETTVASTRRSDINKPLGSEWIQHWRRSKNPLPKDCQELSLEEVEKSILSRL